MRWHNVASGETREAEEGALNWPWVPSTEPAEGEEPGGMRRAREAAQGEVRDRLEAASEGKPRSKSKSAEPEVADDA